MTPVNDLAAGCGVELNRTKGSVNDHETNQDREDSSAEFKKLLSIVLCLFYQHEVNIGNVTKTRCKKKPKTN